MSAHERMPEFLASHLLAAAGRHILPFCPPIVTGSESYDEDDDYDDDESWLEEEEEEDDDDLPPLVAAEEPQLSPELLAFYEGVVLDAVGAEERAAGAATGRSPLQPSARDSEGGDSLPRLISSDDDEDSLPDLGECPLPLPAGLGAAADAMHACTCSGGRGERRRAAQGPAGPHGLAQGSEILPHQQPCTRRIRHRGGSPGGLGWAGQRLATHPPTHPFRGLQADEDGGSSRKRQRILSEVDADESAQSGAGGDSGQGQGEGAPGQAAEGSEPRPKALGQDADPTWSAGAPLWATPAATEPEGAAWPGESIPKSEILPTSEGRGSGRTRWLLGLLGAASIVAIGRILPIWRY